METSTIVNKFKQHFFAQTGERLDFRKHVFVENQHGAYPTVNYEFGERVVTELYKFGLEFINDNKANYPDFSGWNYNTAMEVDKLRISTIATRVNSVCDDLSSNYYSFKTLALVDLTMAFGGEGL